MTGKYWPAGGKLRARITNDGELVCIFTAPPADQIGHAMAKVVDSFDEEKEIEACHLAFLNDRNMKAADWTVFRSAWLACARSRAQQ